MSLDRSKQQYRRGRNHCKQIERLTGKTLMEAFSILSYCIPSLSPSFLSLLFPSFPLLYLPFPSFPFLFPSSPFFSDPSLSACSAVVRCFPLSVYCCQLNICYVLLDVNNIVIFVNESFHQCVPKSKKRRKKAWARPVPTPEATSEETGPPSLPYGSLNLPLFPLLLHLCCLLSLFCFRAPG